MGRDDDHDHDDAGALTTLTRLALLAPTDLERAAPGWATRRTGLREELLAGAGVPGAGEPWAAGVDVPDAVRTSPQPAARRRWVPIAAAAATLAVVGGVGVGVRLLGPGSDQAARPATSSTSVPAPLGDLAAVTNELAAAARAHPFPVQRPGTYSYRKVRMVDHGVLVTMEAWAAYDGRLWGRTTPAGGTPGRIEREPTWQDNPTRVEAGRIPSEPAAILVWLTRRYPDAATISFHYIDDLLSSPWLTGAQRAGLFQAIGRLSLVQRPSYGRDSTGRLGVLLRSPRGPDMIEEVLYDPVTSMPLEIRRLAKVPPDSTGTTPPGAPSPTGAPGSYQVRERVTLLELRVVDRLPTS